MSQYEISSNVKPPSWIIWALYWGTLQPPTPTPYLGNSADPLLHVSQIVITFPHDFLRASPPFFYRPFPFFRDQTGRPQRDYLALSSLFSSPSTWSIPFDTLAIKTLSR